MVTNNESTKTNKQTKQASKIHLIPSFHVLTFFIFGNGGGGRKKRRSVSLDRARPIAVL